MQRVKAHFKVHDTCLFKSQILDWAQQFNTIAWLDSNEHHEKNSQFDGILAVGVESSLVTDSNNGFEQLKKYQSQNKDFIFGFLAYDLKNDVENLISENYDGLNFPDLYFFRPKKLIFISGKHITFKYLSAYKKDIKKDFTEIQTPNTLIKQEKKIKITVKPRIKKEAYLQKVEKIIEHIHKGEIYEANFCQEFYSEKNTINPVAVYKNLNEISKTPFAAFFKYNKHYLLSASPERYLKKTGTKIISQPIKGTAKRSSIKEQDLALKQHLKKDPKEKAENIMIVDLVRNDLSKFAVKGSVRVEELCAVHSFKQVHQMISTISTKIKADVHPVDIIKSTYPMGSMTGAPKVSAMKIIECQEETKRGLYSGTVGYFTPDGDFDFNVIIRSILYNEKKRYVSFSVGSAITSKSVAQTELEECLLKAKAMHKVLV